MCLVRQRSSSCHCDTHFPSQVLSEGSEDEMIQYRSRFVHLKGFLLTLKSKPKEFLHPILFSDSFQRFLAYAIKDFGHTNKDGWLESFEICGRVLHPRRGDGPGTPKS